MGKKDKLNGNLVIAVASASLGMFTFGFNTGVINAPQAVIEKFYNESFYHREGRQIGNGTLTLLWAFTVSVFAIGGMIGGVLAGWWADKLGRKRGMLLNTISGIIGALLMGLAKEARSYEMVIIGRFVIGFTSGIYTGVTPMYNSEVSPTNLRGAIGTVNQLAVTIGMLISQVLGLNSVLGTDALWPLLLALTGVPVILQIAILSFCPETPRYLLLIKRDSTAAKDALLKLRGPDETAVDKELDQYRRESEFEKSEEKMTVCQVLTKKSLRSPLLLAIMMHFSQQFSGINTIFYYSTTLFESAGLSNEEAQYATLGVGGIMVVMTLVSIPLMDVAGRRSLHLTGLGGMAVMSIVFTVSFSQIEKQDWLRYLTITSALIVVVFFALGPGSIPWMIVAELFSQGPRPGAISIAVLLNWLANFVVGLIFPPLQGALEDLVFVPFTVLLVFFFVFLFFKLPETKNKTIEEITTFFNTKAQRGQLDKEPKETYEKKVDDAYL